MKQDMIVILDLGSEENPRLAREIRALGVYSEIYPHDITLEELNALPNVKGVILNGGPNHVVDGVEIDACSDIYGCGLPLPGNGKPVDFGDVVAQPAGHSRNIGAGCNAAI